jgi:hypothetical protein
MCFPAILGRDRPCSNYGYTTEIEKGHENGDDKCPILKTY